MHDEIKRETITQSWPSDRVPLGIPLLQLLFAVTLDFLQIFKSETMKPLVDRGSLEFSDVPYEAAIAAAGALIAGIIGIITSLLSEKRILRVLYTTSSLLGELILDSNDDEYYQVQRLSVPLFVYAGQLPLSIQIR